MGLDETVILTLAQLAVVKNYSFMYAKHSFKILPIGIYQHHHRRILKLLPQQRYDTSDFPSLPQHSFDHTRTLLRVLLPRLAKVYSGDRPGCIKGDN